MGWGFMIFLNSLRLCWVMCLMCWCILVGWLSCGVVLLCIVVIGVGKVLLMLLDVGCCLVWLMCCV